MADASATTPLEWLRKLDKRLRERGPTLAMYDQYYRGEHRMLFSSTKFREAFGGLFNKFSDNWMPLVVDAVEERLNVEGFRLGPNLPGDTEAWSIWQRNDLDALSQVAHTEALINGVSYALVWRDPDTKKARITVEHPLQVIVATDPENRNRRLAALKEWIDDDGYLNATVYLPEALYKFRSQSKAQAGTSVSQWDERHIAGENWPLANPLSVVPMVPLCNRPRLLSEYESEIANVIPTQDAANKLMIDMLVAAEFAAFRQRWATGLDVPRDPDTQEPIAPFKAEVDRLWVTKSKDANFGEFGETDLKNYVEAIQMMIQHIASRTRTPPHYFYLSGQFPSGDSIKSAETGLVAKAKRKQRHFGEAWETVLQLAFKAEGNAKSAAVEDSETIWADPEFRSESERADALVKRLAIGVPTEQLWEDAGYTPQQIARFKDMRAQEPPPPPQVRETLTGIAPTASEELQPASAGAATGG